MSDIGFRSVHEWIENEYHPGVQACAVDVHEWFEGRYQIDEFVGAGHTSVVFKAIDSGLTARPRLSCGKHGIGI